MLSRGLHSIDRLPFAVSPPPCSSPSNLQTQQSLSKMTWPEGLFPSQKKVSFLHPSAAASPSRPKTLSSFRRRSLPYMLGNLVTSARMGAANLASGSRISRGILPGSKGKASSKVRVLEIFKRF